MLPLSRNNVVLVFDKRLGQFHHCNDVNGKENCCKMMYLWYDIGPASYHAAVSDIIDTEDMKTYSDSSPFSDQLPTSFLHNELMLQ